LPTSPVTREAPFLYVDADGNYQVFVPEVLRDSAGVSWDAGSRKGSSLSIDTFYIAKPGDSIHQINQALARGRNLLLTPGVYALDAPIRVPRASTVVLGLGFPTLVPSRGRAAMEVKGQGVKVAGVLFDAGPRNSPVLLSVGGAGVHRGKRQDPTTLSDVFFRIGGATPGRASESLVVDADGTLLDNVWAWRADHGNGVGWTSNTADHGVVVRGDGVTAYGLFVEHYQKEQTLWDGDDGTVVFFQNEMPYDPPSQAAWMERADFLGYPALLVNERVRSFHGYGMGSYSFFNQHVDIFASSAFEVPATLPKGSLQDLLTIFLDANNGAGGILNVVNDVGGSSTIANPDTPVTVQSYP
jgi:hypothetical protein